MPCDVTIIQYYIYYLSIHLLYLHALYRTHYTTLTPANAEQRHKQSALALQASRTTSAVDTLVALQHELDVRNTAIGSAHGVLDEIEDLQLGRGGDGGGGSSGRGSAG